MRFEVFVSAPERLKKYGFRLALKVLLLFSFFFVFPFLPAFGGSAPAHYNDSVKVAQMLKRAESLPYDSALLLLKRAGRLADKYHLKVLSGRIYFVRGNLEMKKDKLTAADSDYLLAYNVLSNSNKDTLCLSLLNKLAVCSYYLGDNQKVVEYATSGLKLAQKLHNRSMEGKFCNLLGVAMDGLGSYAEAIHYYEKAQTLFTLLKDERHLIAIELNLGDLYETQGDLDKAEQFYQKALLEAKRIKNDKLISIAYINLANIYSHRKKYHEALKYMFKSLAISRKANDRYTEALTLNNIGDSYQHLQAYDSAFSYYNRSLQLAKKIHSVRTLSLSLYNLADIYEKKNDLNKALTLATESWNLVKKGGDVDDKLSNLKQLQRLFAEKGDYVRAYDYLKKYVTIYDSVYSAKNRDRLEKEKIKFALKSESQSLKLARERQKLFRAYMMVSFFVLLLIMLVSFFLIRLRTVRNRELKKYYNIFNAFPDIYFRIDAEGIVTEVSPSVKSVSGYERDEVLGKSVYDFIEINREWPRIKKILQRLQHVKDYGLTIRMKNGQLLFCSLNIHDMRNKEGELIGFEGVLLDITDRVLAEKRRRKSEAELKEANASKDKILSIIGHDLVGPIGTQKSILDMLIEDVDEFSREEILQLLKTMKPSLDATFSMIENLLSWARIMRRSIKPNLQPGNIAEVVKKSFDLLGQQAAQKNIRLHYEGEDKVNAVFDKNLMDIVIRNLISNAIKFSFPDSEIRVSVQSSENGVTVRVKDQGTGLTPDQVRKILKETEKLESQPGTRKEKGTGLGLVVVKEFIRMNNGQLQVESQPGKGTTFSFTLPAADLS
jgi:PAS domain S-box-containing protein